MPKRINWEYDCPQFVDFSAECSGNTSPKDDIFFDCQSITTPSQRRNLRNSTPRSAQRECLEENENRLLDKMTASLSIIENTPKKTVKSIKSKLLSKKFTSSVHPQAPKPGLDDKANAIPMSSEGLHRSQSFANLNKMAVKPNFKGLRKRSSSFGDLTIHRPEVKKQTYPMTPMCLKRTKNNQAKRKALKSTEEMELEEIAKLQKQLRDDLRLNELNLKRLRLNKNPISKSAHAENLRITRGCHAEKFGVSEKKPRRILHTAGHAAVNREAMKIDSILKSSTNTIDDEKDLKNAKCPSVSSAASSSSSDAKEYSARATKSVASKKYGFHSGVMFQDSLKKCTTTKPFSFSAKLKERSLNIETSLTSSTVKATAKENYDKENIRCDEQPSAVWKTKAISSMKGVENDKELASVKKTDLKIGAGVFRGLFASDILKSKN